MARILIPEKLFQGTHAGARALSRAGDHVDLAWSYGPRRSWTVGRHIHDVHHIHSAMKDREAYARDVLALAERYDIVFPFYEESTQALVDHAYELAEQRKAPFPPKAAFEICRDKMKTMAHAKSIGIGAPASCAVEDESDVRAAGRDLRFPIVMKARGGSGVKHGLRMARDEDELLRHFETLASHARGAETGILLQEFTPGYINDANVLADRGRVLQTITQFRKLMYPISGGVGCVNVTTHDDVTKDAARRLLESLEWTGPANVEFKRDARDNSIQVIEINPRFWGTINLSIQAGVPFPVMARDMLLGREVRERSYRAGERYLFMLPRGVYAYRQMIRFGGWRAVRDPERYVKTHVDFDWRDPIPDLVRLQEACRTLIKRRETPRDPAVPDDLINRLDVRVPLRRHRSAQDSPAAR